MTNQKNLAILALSGILLAGCAVSPGLDPNPPPGVRLPAQVVYVIDGDTIIVTTGRHRFRVRLLGIDAPEDTRRHECFGAQATAELRRLLPTGSRVRLEPQRHRDPYDRALAFIWRPDGSLVNQILLRHGYATTLFLPPPDGKRPVGKTDHPWADLTTAEKLARHHRTGLWRTCRPRSPPGGITRTTWTAAPASPPLSIGGHATGVGNCGERRDGRRVVRGKRECDHPPIPTSGTD